MTPHPLLIFSQSYYMYLIQVADTNLASKGQTVQIQISWLLLQKPADLDLHCLKRQGISGFSRTKVNLYQEIYCSKLKVNFIMLVSVTYGRRLFNMWLKTLQSNLTKTFIYTILRWCSHILFSCDLSYLSQFVCNVIWV